MEGKMIIEESSSKEFQVLEKVFQDEINLDKSKDVESGLSDVEFQRVKGLERKGLNLWTKFPWFDNASRLSL